jgi:hypothetical protein
MPDRMPEDMSDRMPEDLPVRKCINVMVGITRSKVIFEGGPHYFRMESFEYHVFNDSAILKESVGASMDKASCTRE